jgi:hypothetical protein
VAGIINRDDAPTHLFTIPELDFSGDLFADRVAGPWFRLGAWTITQNRGDNDIEDVVSRQSLLIPRDCFATIFDKLESIGNVLHDLGKPEGSILYSGENKEYKYLPFHQFEFLFTSAVGEPLVFLHLHKSDVELFVNPDILLFFELEERTPGCGIWWDPRKGVDAILHHLVNQDTLKVVEIRTDYLLRYLQARQMSLLVGHYRHLHYDNPSDSAVTAFVKEDVTLGSPEQGAKAILQNWGFRQDIPTHQPYLQRRLHLWFEIRPPAIDIEDPWTDQPSFDPYTFTLPTRCGPVAPARWKHSRSIAGRNFEGAVCDFGDLVYFRQEVLIKYETASGFDVDDNGSVSHYPYWSLVRSTARIGNELVAAFIGDFAEGIPFEEWPHWRQYAVEPPSPETANALGQEQTVSSAVNSLVEELQILNASFAEFGISLGLADDIPVLWNGSLNSLAGRQMKWVYPAIADDDEFLKRATLTSTLVIDELQPASLREVLSKFGGNLHMTGDNPPQSLGSIKLLQRVALVAVLIEDLRPDIAEIQTLVRQAEGVKNSKKGQFDLQDELKRVYKRIQNEFKPLACLYDLRTYGGIAHSSSKDKVSNAVLKLGLPKKKWHRTDYIRLLNLVSHSINAVSNHLQVATQIVQNCMFSESS